MGSTLRARGLRSTLFLALALLIASPLSARYNLPQVSKRIPIRGERHTELRQFFAGQREGAVMPAGVEGVLLDALEPVYWSGCREMISHWGEEARASARDSVRVLYRAMSEASTVQVVLAYRCSSALRSYAEGYDERLAWLTVAPTHSEIVLLPHAGGVEDDFDLSRIEFTGVAGVPSGTAVRLRIEIRLNDLVLAGPEAWEVEKEIWYVARPGGPEPVLDLEVAKDEYSHSDGPEGDSEKHAKTELRLERNAVGEVVAVVAETAKTETDKPPTKSTVRYRWRPENQRFEPTSK